MKPPSCAHPKMGLVPGLRIRARWGSFPTVVCPCGAWRLAVGIDENWRTDSIEEAAKDDGDD